MLRNLGLYKVKFGTCIEKNSHKAQRNNKKDGYRQRNVRQFLQSA